MPNQPNEKDQDLELNDNKKEKEEENVTERSPLSEQDPSIKNH